MANGMIDLTGQKFGRLTVVHRADNAVDGTARWVSDCACGQQAISLGSNLRRGTAKSCGCLQREKAATRAAEMGAATRTHGHAIASTREYNTWASMLQRCQNPDSQQYKNYGERGITVCDRWKSFENFLADMGEKPPGTSIERKDNELGYSPENCRWATAIEQNNNCRSNKLIAYRGTRMTVSAAVRSAGSVVAVHIARQRIDRDGWPVERAVECTAA